jgi:hypothetical protein
MTAFGLSRKSRIYPIFQEERTVEWSTDEQSRGALRAAVAHKWLEEDPYTKYRYNVERCDDGARVYLLRPAQKNKGFDFQVNLEGFQSLTTRPRQSERPKHEDMIDDIRLKLSNHSAQTQQLFAAIADVFECRAVPRVLSTYSDLVEVTSGLAPQKLLFILKWLFIEQDLTYWSYTGRDKLMAAIEESAFHLH